MIEVIVTDKDGKRWCHVLKDGATYELRGDEVSIEVSRVRRGK